MLPCSDVPTCSSLLHILLFIYSEFVLVFPPNWNIVLYFLGEGLSWQSLSCAMPLHLSTLDMLVPVSTQGMVVWFFTCLLFSYFLCFAILIGFPSLGVVSFCVLYTESLWISEFEKASVQILCSLYIIIQTWINSQKKKSLWIPLFGRQKMDKNLWSLLRPFFHSCAFQLDRCLCLSLDDWSS
jgi:hypothetical protein